ncbi:MAG: hypothetical protein HKP10_02545 [Kiritimatiellales bacterium]|nr:hypothetical protein [Pontiella sp.]NNJ70150.1 hypothetical protein [Kiritimatiellales bacterium]
MKKMMSIAVMALMVVGSAAYACDSCGCSAKKADKKAECTACPAEKKAECTACTKDKKAEKCAAGCTKACCAKKAEA